MSTIWDHAVRAASLVTEEHIGYYCGGPHRACEHKACRAVSALAEADLLAYGEPIIGPVVGGEAPVSFPSATPEVLETARLAVLVEWGQLHERLRPSMAPCRQLADRSCELHGACRVVLAIQRAGVLAAVLPTPTVPDGPLTTDEVAAWDRARFGNRPIELVGLKLAEEAGEVCGGVVKRAEGAVRPDKGLVTWEDWTRHIEDEIGDVAIVLRVMAARLGTTLEELEARRFRGDVSQRTAQEHPAPAADQQDGSDHSISTEWSETTGMFWARCSCGQFRACNAAAVVEQWAAAHLAHHQDGGDRDG